MPYYLYILASAGVENRRYVGTTENLERRIAKHNRREVRSTKAYAPWIVIYRETYSTKTEARKRELELKKNTKKRLLLFRAIEKKNAPIV